MPAIEPLIYFSSLQLLLKQHPAAIDTVADTFYLSEGEKRLLLSAGLGEGLFFAGANHVSINIKNVSSSLFVENTVILLLNPLFNSRTQTLHNNQDLALQNIRHKLQIDLHNLRKQAVIIVS